VRQGRTCADDVRAAGLLTEALALWRGDALAGLTGGWAEAERELLRQERLAAEHDLVDARLRAGEGEALVTELAARADRHPLDERVAAQYVLALHRAGRSADALEHYRRVRERLVDELGADPGPELAELHRLVLAGDPTLTAPAAVVAEPAVVPRQLPAVPRLFVGRDEELRRLDDVLARAPASGSAVITAIAGAGGIGKTWLALHWANRHLDRFPDGQLFVDLRGFDPDGRPMAPHEAVRGFLDALGVEPPRAPGAARPGRAVSTWRHRWPAATRSRWPTPRRPRPGSSGSTPACWPPSSSPPSGAGTVSCGTWRGRSTPSTTGVRAWTTRSPSGGRA
jgi:hypothetical protein